ncbi:MAG: helix-turn-helix transcriptional regulator [Actinomycetota bacterium]|nr:helix-turn-helix transcriptional regulator [Actinomycetota bacterium]
MQAEMDARGWTPADLERASGINRSRFSGWKQGSSVSIENARAIAATFGAPLLTVLVAAQLITPEEASQKAVAPTAPSAAALTTDQLLNEIRQRISAGENPQRHPRRFTSEDIDKMRTKPGVVVGKPSRRPRDAKRPSGRKASGGE